MARSTSDNGSSVHSSGWPARDPAAYALGAFTVSDTHDARAGAARWTKQYRGKHPVEYAATRVAGALAGQWQISDTSSGGFAL